MTITQTDIEYRVEYLKTDLTERFEYVREVQGDPKTGRLYLFLDQGVSKPELYEYMAEYGYLPDRTRGQNLGSKTIASVLMEWKIHDPWF